MNKIVLGIIGKIGSGKSTVSQILADNGWAIIDADKIVYDLYKPNGRGSAKIQTFFGDEYLKKDGSVNRQKLKRTLLKNTKKWAILNNLIHPLVLDEIKRYLDKSTNNKVALEIQIFNEKSLKDLTNHIWKIESSEKISRKRVSDKFSIDEIEAILAQQNEIKWPKNATIIKNTGSKKALVIKIKSLLNELN